jgi:hypothetical protein
VRALAPTLAAGPNRPKFGHVLKLSKIVFCTRNGTSSPKTFLSAPRFRGASKANPGSENRRSDLFVRVGGQESGRGATVVRNGD